MGKPSQLIRVVPNTMTSMVDCLIKRGLLQRCRAQQDRRRCWLPFLGKVNNFTESTAAKL
ncbi:MAG: hypothetical protein GX240_00205 [Candidatus Atribacteria bacterium]|nr:hypothetical protein [Candidatus Atribacteria bacterium]